MRAQTLITTTAFALIATPAFAQTTIKKVIEPVTPTVNDIINAPIEYDDQGVVKAQYFKADDLSEAEYKALLEEADRVRAYQSANGQAPVIVERPKTPAGTVIASPERIRVEMTQPNAPVQATTSLKVHTVMKGDTLYNISKRYDAEIGAIQDENGLAGTNLSIGQKLRIPGVVSSSLNTTVLQPIFVSAPMRDGVVTRRVVQKAPATTKPVIASGTQIYAVLPKDTLYSISRRTCVGVKDLIETNEIADPNTLKPGQRLTLPAGHCLVK